MISFQWISDLEIYYFFAYFKNSCQANIPWEDFFSTKQSSGLYMCLFSLHDVNSPYYSVWIRLGNLYWSWRKSITWVWGWDKWKGTHGSELYLVVSEIYSCRLFVFAFLFALLESNSYFLIISLIMCFKINVPVLFLRGIELLHLQSFKSFFTLIGKVSSSQNKHWKVLSFKIQ